MAELKITEPNRSEEESLPFSKGKQEALIAYLLTNDKFFVQARHRIKPEWFTDGRLNQIWTIALKFATLHNRAPKVNEVKEAPAVMAMDNRETIVIQTTIERCLGRMVQYGLDALGAELTDWLHARIYMAAVSKSSAHFNSATKLRETAKFQEAYKVLKLMNREIEDTSFEQGQAEPFDDPQADFESLRVDASKALTFGLSAFDRLLLPRDEDDKLLKGAGSLLKGDTTILLAPTNVGKTTTMITVAAANIHAGKNVLLLTHEGRAADIKMKIWLAMAGVNKPTFMRALADPIGQKSIKGFQALVKKHLHYIPMNKAGLCVEDVEATIRRAQDRWAADHEGRGFDMLVDDYAAKLTTQQAKGGQFARRQIDEVVYSYFVQLALEYDFHCLTAIQTNREGSKVNQGSKFGRKSESRLLSMEDVSESWGPMTSATNVISINRDPEAKARNRVTFFICKSRSSETDLAVTCRSDFGACRTHGEDLGCTWYRTGSTLSQKIDGLMEQYRGKEIPMEEVARAEAVAGGA